MHGIDRMGFGMAWSWWIIGLIVLVAIIWLMVKTINQNNRVNQPENKSALDILKERYAKGEIKKEEFKEKKKSISLLKN